MRYPVLAASKCAELAHQLAAGKTPAVDAAIQWSTVGDEVDLDIALVVELASRVTSGARQWTDRDRDRYEGQTSVDLYGTLGSLPPEVLDDRGFWRYLSVRHFWEFIAWREEGPFSQGNYVKYVDAASPAESVLTRMFMRAQALGGSSASRLAGAIPKSTDFWRSHILRVRTGTSPAMTRAFADRQLQVRLASDALRDTARRLNRRWTNIVLHVYDDAEAASVIDSLWPMAELSDAD